MKPTPYSFEIWTNSGLRLADISPLLKDRQYSITRNDVETLEASVDINEISSFASSIGTSARSLLLPYQNNIRVKRGSTYLFGVQIISSTPSFNSNSQDIAMKCSGYLNLFKDRYITKDYSATESTSIATDHITTTNTDSDTGVTINASQYATGVTHDKSYPRNNVKDNIKNLSNLTGSKFDFAFSADKVFTTYEALGAVRGDFKLMWGPNGNIKSYSVEQVLPYNRITCLGSGFGQDQITSIQNDATSQSTYYLREKIIQYNSVSVQTTLDDHAASDLDDYKDLRYIPVLTTTGSLLPSTFLSVGDKVFLDLTANAYTNNILGWYRIEKMEVSLDANDYEQDINLYFDNKDVDQDEGA